MNSRWLRCHTVDFAPARRVLMAIGTAAVVVLLTHPASAQDGQGQAAPPRLDPFSAGAAERTRNLPAAPPAAAPTRPWGGKFLPDGQPELPKGVWQASQGSTRYIDREQPGFLKASRVVDPPEGKIPYQPWALELKKTADYDLEHPTKPWHVDAQARCLYTVPRMHHYVTTYKIYQAPGFVVFHFEQGHRTRAIPLDGSPHPPSDIKLWMGDGRGHWEGNTLVVDTTNLNAVSKMSSSGDFMTPNAHLSERFTFINEDTMVYEVTIDDPTVFTRPWTMRAEHKILPNTAGPGLEGEILEAMCYEGQAEGIPSEIHSTRVP